MVPKESGFSQSVAASGMCARKALRFPSSIATMRDGKLVQMPHSCYHVETIRHPNSSYVTTKLYGKSVTLRISHITTVIVTLNTPNNLEHVRIFIPRAPTLGIPETPEHHMLGTDRYVGDSSHISSTRKVHLSSTGKVHVYITRKSTFPLTRKSIFPLQEKSMFTLQESPSLL